MKRMKNALGAALSILLTISMVLGSTAVAVAEEGTNQATSYASQFDAAYNTMLNDAKSLEFKAYTGTDAQYGAEDIKGSQEAVDKYWADVLEVFKYYAMQKLDASSVKRADVPAEGMSAAPIPTSESIKEESYTRAFEVTTSDGSTSLYNIHIADDKGNIAIWEKTKQQGTNLEGWFKKVGSELVEYNATPEDFTWQPDNNTLYVATGTPTKTNEYEDFLKTLKNQVSWIRVYVQNAEIIEDSKETLYSFGKLNEGDTEEGIIVTTTANVKTTTRAGNINSKADSQTYSATTEDERREKLESTMTEFYSLHPDYVHFSINQWSMSGRYYWSFSYIATSIGTNTDRMTISREFYKASEYKYYNSHTPDYYTEKLTIDFTQEVKPENNLFFYNGNVLVYQAKVELTDTLAAPLPQPTKAGDVGGNFIFEGWKTRSNIPSAAYKDFGGLKVKFFEKYMSEGKLIFDASYAEKAEEGDAFHHLYFEGDAGTIIITVRHNEKFDPGAVPTREGQETETFRERFVGWKEVDVAKIKQASLLELFKTAKEETFSFDDLVVTRDMAFEGVFVREDKQQEQKEPEENPEEEGDVLGEDFENPDNSNDPEVLGADYTKTGDAAPIFVIVALLLMSGATFAVFGRKKKEEK